MARRTREVRRLRDELLDELLAGADPAEVFADGGVLDALKKAVAERALDAEMDAHLEGERSGGNQVPAHQARQPRPRQPRHLRRIAPHQCLVAPASLR